MTMYTQLYNRVSDSVCYKITDAKLSGSYDYLRSLFQKYDFYDLGWETELCFTYMWISLKKSIKI